MKENKVFISTGFALAVCLFLSFGFGFQDEPKIFNIPVKILKGISDFNEGFDQLQYLYNVIKQVERGERPSEKYNSNDWQAPIDYFKNVTDGIKWAGYATDFDTSPYSIPVDQFKCATMNDHISKLTLYRNRIDQAVIEGKNDLKQLDSAISKGEKSLEVIRLIIELSIKVSGDPIYGEVFKWDWFPLQNSIKPQISDYISIIRKHRIKYAKEIDNAVFHRNNLDYNLKYTLPNLCKPPAPVRATDTYRGQTSSQKIKLVLNRIDRSYFGGEFYRGGDGQSKFNITSINVNGKNIQFTCYHSTVSNTREEYVGSFSSDYSSVSLKQTKPGPNLNFTLIK